MLPFFTKEDLEKINELFKLAFKINLIIGGLVMMSYYYTIGFFPYDLSIGDGLLFIGVAITFGFIDLLFTTIFSCVGFKLRTPLLFFKRIYIIINKGSKTEEESLSMIPRKTEWVLWIPAILGWLIIIKFSYSNDIYKAFKSFFILAFSAWLCAHSISSYLELKEEEALNTAPLKKNTKKLKLIYLLVILIFPLFIEGVLSTMSTGAMRLMKIRQDNMTVHVSNPYAQFAIEAGVKGNASLMGRDYLKFENVDVLYTGPGRNTVLRFSDNNANTTQLTVPTEKIFIPN